MSRSITFLMVALILVSIVPSTTVSAISVSLGDVVINCSGKETTVKLFLEEVPDGFSGFNLNMNLSNGSVAEVVGINYPEWAELNQENELPATEDILLKAADVNNLIEAGATQVELAGITFRGLFAGDSNVVFSSPNFDDESGNNIDVVLVNGNVSVKETVEVLYNITSYAGSGGSIDPYGPVQVVLGDSLTFNISAEEGCIIEDVLVDGNSVGVPETYSFENVNSDHTINATFAEFLNPIGLLSPQKDIYSNETVKFSWHIDTSGIEQAFVSYGGNITSLPVINGNITTEIGLGLTSDILVGFNDSGRTISKHFFFDGDFLLGEDEERYGFDPLDPDSDCILTPENETGDGIPDGFETFADNLPIYVKIGIGADPFSIDTDGDTLSDEFELLRMGLFTSAVSADSDNNTISDAQEDPDEDGLSNFEEQTAGTNPLFGDTDKDSIPDLDEVLGNTNPLLKDSDNDLLDDDSELRLGTDPCNQDSNANGILDGNEEYTSELSFINETLDLSVRGTGDAVKRAEVHTLNYSHLIADDILLSDVYSIEFGNGTIESTIKIQYNILNAGNVSNLSIFKKNNETGSFDAVASSPAGQGALISTFMNESGQYCVMDVEKWEALFETPVDTSLKSATIGSLSTKYSLSKEDSSVQSVARSLPAGKKGSAMKVSSDNPEETGGHIYNSSPSWVYPLMDGDNSGSDLAELMVVDFRDVNGDASSEYQIGETKSTATLLDSSGSVLKSTSTLYQMIENGDFYNEYMFWSPDRRMYDYNSYSGYEYVLESGNYYSYPNSMKFDVWNRQGGKTVEILCRQYNVDLSYADTLTFKYNKIDGQYRSSVGSYGISAWVDGSGTQYNPDFQDRGYSTNGWKEASIDVSGIEEMTTLNIRVWIYCSSSSSDLAWITYLVDDISAWSTQPEGTPTTAVKRFNVFDADTHEFLQSATVICNGQSENTDGYGNTPDFVFDSAGTYEYSVDYHGYDIVYGQLTVQKGENSVTYVPMSQITGSLYVTSNPTDATIYIDGYEKGNTPIEVVSLAVGSHTVEARKDGYVTTSVSANVVEDQMRNVYITLPSTFGSISVSTDPAESKVYVDDVYCGLSSSGGLLEINSVGPGNHFVNVTKNGYYPFSQEITVTAGQTVNVNAVLTEIPPDAEGDGLLDADEVNGFLDPYGRLIYTDQFSIDTDGDGLSDGYEAGELITDGNGRTFYKARSDPRMVDSDGDGLFDPDELDCGTNPLLPDSDGDLLGDLYEFEIGTDPLDPNTDGDAYNDGVEVYDNSWGGGCGYPLIYRKESAVDDFIALCAGASAGDFDDIIGLDTSNPNYLYGHILGGFFLVGDFRDIFASIVKQDSAGTVLNGVALCPAIGDGEKIAKSSLKYVNKYPDKASEAAMVVAKLSGNEVEALKIIRERLGTTTYDRLVTRYSETYVVKLYKKNVDLKLLDEIFEDSQIYTRYPGLSDYIARTLVNEEGMASRVKIDLDALSSARKAGKTQSEQSRLGHIQGAFAEYSAKIDYYADGVEIITDISHVTKPGLDLVLKEGDTLRIIECKAVKDLSISKLKNYINIDKNTGEITGFNINYALLHLDESYFTNSNINKEFILYINSPESSAIASRLNLPASLPYSIEDSLTGETVPGTVQVIVIAVNK